MRGRTTYWHLEGLRRKPSDYEIASSRLLSYPSMGIAVDTPGKEWFRRYQAGSPLQCERWEDFRDPRETTYAEYTQLQSAKEVFVDGVLRSVEGSSHDADLSSSWIDLLAVILPTLRFPIHGFQMVAAYVGSMAPSGRLVIVAGLQAADEVRRIQRIAYRMRQLELVHPGFGSASKQAWLHDPRWQPLRRLVEELLTTYDWGEALVALNLAIKPLFDEFFLGRLASSADRAQDRVLGKVLFSLAEDGEWHRAWSASLFRMVGSSADVRLTIRGWLDTWYPRAKEAIAPWDDILEATAANRQASLGEACRRLWAECGIGEEAE